MQKLNLPLTAISEIWAFKVGRHQNLKVMCPAGPKCHELCTIFEFHVACRFVSLSWLRPGSAYVSMCNHHRISH